MDDIVWLWRHITSNDVVFQGFTEFGLLFNVTWDLVQKSVTVFIPERASDKVIFLHFTGDKLQLHDLLLFDSIIQLEQNPFELVLNVHVDKMEVSFLFFILLLSFFLIEVIQILVQKLLSFFLLLLKLDLSKGIYNFLIDFGTEGVSGNVQSHLVFQTVWGFVL